MKTRATSRPPAATSAMPRPAVIAPPAPTASPAPVGWYWLMGLAMLITAGLYIPSLTNGLTNWDDPDYLTNSPLLDFSRTPLRAYFTTIVAGNIHPLTMLSLSLDYTLAGASPAQVHRTSLLLHVLNVGLAFGLGWHLSGGRRLVAFLVALWFGIHPMHVESVAWVAERKDVLYGFFFLLSLLTYWCFLTRRRAYLWLSVSFLAAILANLAKPAAVILPAVLLLLTYWHARSLTVRMLWPTGPFFLLSAGFARLTLHAQGSALAINEAYSFWERTQLGGYALVNYVLKFGWPLGLSAFYGRPGAGTPFPAIFLAYTLLSGGGLLGLLWLYRRSTVWFFGVAFFLLNLILTLQLIKAVGSAAYADRYTYIAYIGLFFALAMTLDQRARRPWRGVALALTGLFSVACAWLTVQRTAVWKNSETLWTDVLKTQPFSSTAYSNRGLHYEHTNRLDEALADYSMAVQADPKPLFRANRAYLLSKLNRPAEAEADADVLLSLDSANVVALTLKGTALVGRQQIPAAITYLQRAYHLDSTYLNGLVNLGSAYFAQHQYGESIRFYKKALAQAPNNPAFLTNLGAAYLQNRQYPDALAACRQAIQLDSANGPAHAYACYALVKAGQVVAARPYAQRAQQLGQSLDAGILRLL